MRSLKWSTREWLPPPRATRRTGKAAVPRYFLPTDATTQEQSTPRKPPLFAVTRLPAATRRTDGRQGCHFTILPTNLIRRADDFERECSLFYNVSEPGTAIYCSHERSPPFAGMEPKFKKASPEELELLVDRRLLLAEPTTVVLPGGRSPNQDCRLLAEPRITTLSVKSRKFVLFHLGNKCSNMGGE